MILLRYSRKEGRKEGRQAGLYACMMEKQSTYDVE